MFTFKSVGKLDIVFGYSQDAEPTEVDRLGLKTLSKDYVESCMISRFEALGFKLKEFKVLKKDELSFVETTWGKRLRFGSDRPMYRLTLDFSR